MMMTDSRHPSAQAGMMLLEGLIAILVFSVGVLAVSGMYATAISASGDAKYRSEASLLANELIGQMWVSDRSSGATLQQNYRSPDGAAYLVWFNSVQARLPGVNASDTAPTVNIVADGTAADGTVTVAIFWKLPSEVPGTQAHSYRAVAQVR